MSDESDQERILTVYPAAWFGGRIQTAKRHAYVAETEPYRGERVTSLCGVRGSASPEPFEPGGLKCSRCQASIRTRQGR